MPGRDEPTRVVPVPGGPVLVSGPVEVEMPDGSIVRSDRPVVALCACRRSRRQPFCDTSHRRRSRSSRAGSRSDEVPEDHDPSR